MMRAHVGPRGPHGGSIGQALADLHTACVKATEMATNARCFPSERAAALAALAIQADGIRVMALRAAAPPNVRQALTGRS